MASTVASRGVSEAVVVTGIGMVTPLGRKATEVLRRLEAGASAIAPPKHFGAGAFACPVCAAIEDFCPQDFIAEVKMIRLMSRDAQLAVAAAHLALEDANLRDGIPYAPEDIGLFGATGLAGLPLHEIAPLLKASTDAAGRFNLTQFGETGLHSVSPVLSFKILSNMPVCFVSICENIQGPNAVYTPWEGHGARAIEAGIFALQSGDARCVLAGACDVKTHELAFLALEQIGLFRSWSDLGTGLVPGEGAVFLVLERESAAVNRGASIQARITGWSFNSRVGLSRSDTFAATVDGLGSRPLGAIIAAANGDPALDKAEAEALGRKGIAAPLMLLPKKQVGDLFAAAAPLQVAVGALMARRLGLPVLANCFGHGDEQAAFLLEPA